MINRWDLRKKIDKKYLLLSYIIFYISYYISTQLTLHIPGRSILLIVAFFIGLYILLIYKKFTTYQYWTFGIIGLLIIASYIYSGLSDSRLLVLYFTGIVFYKEDIKNIIRDMLIVRVILVLIAIILGGFYHPNLFGINIGYILILYMCLNDSRFNYKKTSIILFITLLTFIVNPLNLTFPLIIVIALILQALRTVKWGRKILLSKPIMFIYPILLIINFFLITCMSQEGVPGIGKFLPNSINNGVVSIAWLVNKFLSHRLALAKTAFERLGIPFIGNANAREAYTNLLAEYKNNNTYFVVDSGYSLLLLLWGIVVTILIMVCTIYVMRYFIKKEAYNFVIAGIVLALWPILEDILFNDFLLTFWATAIGTYLFPKIKEQKKKMELRKKNGQHNSSCI